MTHRTTSLFLPVNGEEIAAPSIPHSYCVRCREAVLSLPQASLLRDRAFEKYRRKHGLMTADEIRAVREIHGLTQAQFARLLRLGSNTISRWESGRNVQTGAMDVLLRLVRDLPESLRYLKGRKRRAAGG